MGSLPPGTVSCPFTQRDAPVRLVGLCQTRGGARFPLLLRAARLLPGTFVAGAAERVRPLPPAVLWTAKTAKAPQRPATGRAHHPIGGQSRGCRISTAP